MSAPHLPVLAHRAARFNRLLEVMHRSLKEFGRAIKGEVVMSMELDAMGNAMFNNQIPALWAAKAYPSLRSLSAWVEDLVKRCGGRGCGCIDAAKRCTPSLVLQFEADKLQFFVSLFHSTING